MLASDDLHHHIENFIPRYVEPPGEQFGFAQLLDLLRALSSGLGPYCIHDLVKWLRRTLGLDCGWLSPGALVLGARACA